MTFFAAATMPAAASTPANEKNNHFHGEITDDNARDGRLDPGCSRRRVRRLCGAIKGRAFEALTAASAAFTAAVAMWGYTNKPPASKV